MSIQINAVNEKHQGPNPDYDAIVVGAGFAGIRIIVELRNLGLSFKVLEEGNGVGGTW
jgi:cation diffusion facilitator CzcD-associated flavoprotein CzcO